MEGDDGAATVFKRLAASYDTADDDEDVISGVALAGDDIVSLKVDRPPLKRRKCMLDAWLVNECA
jgi:hypothetical protein